MMRRALSTIAGLAISINTIIARVPELPSVAQAADVPAGLGHAVAEPASAVREKK
jgi:hypothetical protein